MISEAIIFATNAHGNQTRKGSDTLYILHPLGTLSIRPKGFQVSEN